MLPSKKSFQWLELDKKVIWLFAYTEIINNAYEVGKVKPTTNYSPLICFVFIENCISLCQSEWINFHVYKHHELFFE